MIEQKQDVCESQRTCELVDTSRCHDNATRPYSASSNETLYHQVRDHDPSLTSIYWLKDGESYATQNIDSIFYSARRCNDGRRCCPSLGMKSGLNSWKLALLVTCVILVVLADVTDTASTSKLALNQKGQQQSSLAKGNCQVHCKPRNKPVCGSDRVTYRSKCRVRFERKCNHKSIRIKHHGSCKGHGRSTQCLVQRRKSIIRAHKPSVGVFIPKCNPDGSYTQVQCHTATGYCWCVDKMGLPLPITTKRIKNRKSSCSESGRRSAKPGRSGKRVCTKADRSTFNLNIIRVFEQEYNRDQPSSRPSSQSQLTKQVTYRHKRIVEWKFTQLDKNKNNKLTKKEVRFLRQMVKKIINPRSCARTFVNYCDLDQDRRILRREWSLCLGVDLSKGREKAKLPPFLSGHNPSKANKANPIMNPHIFTRPIMPNQLNPQQKSTTTEEPNDRYGELPYRAVGRCDVVRDKAMRDNKLNPAVGVFTPACTKLGEYEQAQCHAKFCWCVNQVTGHPIPGTSTGGVKPSCNIRNMKGCRHDMKRTFLMLLMKKLVRERYPQKDATVKEEKSFYDEIARWKFKQLDLSGNRILERKEWKKFKSYTRKVARKGKALRKCGRNFLRYCDKDSNKRISLVEWIDCTGVERNLYSLISRRPGKNPLKEFLRE